MVADVPSDVTFDVAFVGLPSSGKSSIINSLSFKRLLQSGVCRTTIEYKKLDIDIYDDSANKFKVIDLPGISDSEENDTKFNDLTYKHIADANLIIWVSDVHKSFITTHEVNEYNKLKQYIKNLQEETGTIYKIAIMLSKCDKTIDFNNKSETKSKTKSKTKSETNFKPTTELKTTELEEITDLDEDTNINDLVIKVKEKFPNEDIILFNAYGRSYHNEKTSSTLKSFIEKLSGIPSNINTKFDISKYMQNHSEEQKKSYEQKFLSVYDKYINNFDAKDLKQIIYLQIITCIMPTLPNIKSNKLNKSILYGPESEKLKQLWNKLDKEFILEHLIKVCMNDTKPIDKNYRIYLYIIFATEQLSDELSNDLNHIEYDIILMRIIDYELSILNFNETSMLNFSGVQNCKNIISKIMESFDKLKHNNKINIVNNILFINKYSTSITHSQLIFAEIENI